MINTDPNRRLALSARRCSALNTGLRKPAEGERGVIGRGVAVILDGDCETTRAQRRQMKLRRCDATLYRWINRQHGTTLSPPPSSLTTHKRSSGSGKASGRSVEPTTPTCSAPKGRTTH